MTGANTFTAGPQMLGYLYQSQVALLLSIRNLKENIRRKVSLERLDDITFQADGTPTELLQTKHTVNPGSLTDLSAELWRTLRAWSVVFREDHSIRDASRILIAVNTGGAGSVVSFLRATERNEVSAQNILDHIAQTNANEANQPAYAAYMSLSNAERLELLTTVRVIDGFPSIGDIDEELRKEFRLAIPNTHLEAYLDGLMGWWFRKMVAQLSGVNSEVLSEELESEIESLNENFERSALPVYAVDIPPSANFLLRNFVRQLQLFGTTNDSISIAIQNYERAFVHRNRWLRDFELTPDDLKKYDNELKEEWSIRFNQMSQDLDLGEITNEEAGARRLYRWAEADAELVLKKCTDRFVCRGSLHILADSLHIGWHRRYMELIQ